VPIAEMLPTPRMSLNSRHSRRLYASLTGLRVERM